MGRGGKRPGAGRKKNALTKRTRETAEKLAKSGKPLPLDVMLDNMAFAHEAAAVIQSNLIENGAAVPEAFNEFAQLIRFRHLAQDAAKDAAPYMHPRLAPVDDKGKVAGLSVSFVIEG